MQEQGRWYLDFTTMRGSIESDLGKRDFTINAIAFQLRQIDNEWNRINLIDPLDGVGDIKRKLIKATSDAVFLDDPARLLRAFRLAAELDFSIDDQTEVLIQRDYKGITSISGERIRDEFIRILNTNKAVDILHHLDRIGLLDILIPELAVFRTAQGPEKNSYNILEHSLETIEALESLLSATEEEDIIPIKYAVEITKYFKEEIVVGRTRKALLNLAILLHPTIKPQSKKTRGKKTKKSFLKNDQYDATITNTILERLRFSSREKRIIIKALFQQLIFEHLIDTSEFPKSPDISGYFRHTECANIDAIFLGLSHHAATHGFQSGNWYKKYMEIIDYILTKWFQEKALVTSPKLINGHELINHFGLTPGPAIGELLESVQKGYVAGEIETRTDAFNYVKKILKR